MVTKGKLTCECGGRYQEQLVDFEGFEVGGMVCERCNSQTFTEAQAKQIGKLMRANRVFEKKRKIIKIGKSLAVTIPKPLEDLGWKLGKQVEWTQVDKHTFKVRVG